MMDFRKLFSSEDHKELNEAITKRDTDASPVEIAISPAVFSDLGCAAWKLRQKLLDPDTREPKEDLRHLARHVEVIWEWLVDLGLEIQDHTGNPFDSGQSLEVLAFQPAEGITREVVVETVRPTIYFRGRRLLMGQVIVGTPDGRPAGGKNA